MRVFILLALGSAFTVGETVRHRSWNGLRGNITNVLEKSRTEVFKEQAEEAESKHMKEVGADKDLEKMKPRPTPSPPEAEAVARARVAYGEAVINGDVKAERAKNALNAAQAEADAEHDEHSSGVLTAEKIVATALKMGEARHAVVALDQAQVEALWALDSWAVAVENEASTAANQLRPVNVALAEAVKTANGLAEAVKTAKGSEARKKAKEALAVAKQNYQSKYGQNSATGHEDFIRKVVHAAQLRAVAVRAVAKKAHKKALALDESAQIEPGPASTKEANEAQEAAASAEVKAVAAELRAAAAGTGFSRMRYLSGSWSG